MPPDESPNAPVTYVKVVQDGSNFVYHSARGYGYVDLTGLDTSPNNRNVLSGADEINVNPTQYSGGSRVIQYGLVTLRQMIAALGT